MLVVCVLFLSFLTACSPTEKTADSVDIEEKVPTVGDRDNYLNSNELILDFKLTKENGMNFLTIKMKEEFTKKSNSEQYLYLVDLYEEYNSKYYELGSLNGLNVYFDDTDFPAYTVNLRTFEFVGVDVHVDRNIGQRPSEKILHIIDTLDKTQVLSGTKAGLTLAEYENDVKPPIKDTVITSSEEVKGALRASYETKKTDNPTKVPDTETYIKGMTGLDWLELSDNQKFHAVSNALYNLDNNGFTISESEYFYIEALNSFYTDSSTINVPVNEALSSIGIMSGTISK